MSTLITRPAVDDLDAALNNLALALQTHASASVSDAHGINVLYFDTPVYDSSGNNVQYYANAANVVVGQFQLRFSVGNTIYYAPAKTTTLAAQTATPELPSTSDVADQLSTREATQLVTDFVTGKVAYVDAVQSELLIPHTRLGHWEAHAPITVRSRSVYDSAGILVGRYVATIQFNGTKYDIPCDTLLGGPPKTPSFTKCPTISWTGGLHGNFSLNGCTIFLHVDGGEPWPTGFTLTFNPVDGYRPMTYLWEQSLDGSNWTAMTTAEFTLAGAGGITITGGGSGSVTGTSHAAVFKIRSPGGDNSGKGNIRVTFTNDGGSATSCVLAIDMKDTSDSCFIFTAAARAGYLTERHLFDALRYRLTRQRQHWFAEQEWGGYTVFGQWLARWIKPNSRRARLIVDYFAIPLNRAFKCDMGRARWNLASLALGALMRTAMPVVYIFNRNKAREITRRMAGTNYIKRYRNRVRELRAARKTSKCDGSSGCCCG